MLGNEIHASQSDKYAKPSILVVTQLYPNVANSFLGTFVVQQLEHLKTSYTIVVLTIHDIPFTRRHRLRQPRYEMRNGIHVYSLPHMPFWLAALRTVTAPLRKLSLSCLTIDKLLTGRRIRAFARRLHEEYRFSLVHGHEVYFGDEAAPIARLLNIPSVFTLHGLYWYHLQNLGIGVLQRAVANMNATDRLIAPSRISAESYRHKGVRREFQIIPDGIDPPTPVSERLKIPDDVTAFAQGKFVLLTVGFLVPEKRTDQAIITLGRLHRNGMKNAVLIIIGKGRLEPKLREIMKRENLSAAARIVGEVPPQAMPRYYSISDVLVHPSIVESFSMVCLEAMSYGKAVICTSRIGLSEYLHPGRDAIVVAPDDTNALYHAVLSLIQNPSMVRILGQQARLTATSLSWANQVGKIEQVYEGLSHKWNA